MLTQRRRVLSFPLAAHASRSAHMSHMAAAGAASSAASSAADSAAAAVVSVRPRKRAFFRLQRRCFLRT